MTRRPRGLVMPHDSSDFSMLLLTSSHKTKQNAIIDSLKYILNKTSLIPQLVHDFDAYFI